MKITVPLGDVLAINLVLVAGARMLENERGICARVVIDTVLTYADRHGYDRVDELRAALADAGNLAVARAEAVRAIKAIGNGTVVALLVRAGEHMDQTKP